MKVDYVDHMGDDLRVVNAARVSFAKESKEFGDKDKKLLQYLARHNHWTPFSQCEIQLRVKAPIFVARQLFKHKVGLTENEVSRRYVDDPPEFYLPSGWRGRPTNGAKQGSSSDIIETIDIIDYDRGCDYTGVNLSKEIITHHDRCLFLYNDMIKGGVAPEQARMVLPQSMMTEWYWKGSLSAFARVCHQRLDSHAQGETQEIAKMISDIVQPLFPNCWAALVPGE